MRGSLAALAFLCLAPLLAAEPVTTTDPSGDATLQGVNLDGLDLLEATADLVPALVDGQLAPGGATPDTLQAILRVKDAKTWQDAKTALSFQTAEYWLEFVYRGEVFHLTADLGLGYFPDGSVGGGEDKTLGNLYRAGSAPGTWQLLEPTTARLDRAASHLLLSVPLRSVQASDGFAPGPGETLDIIGASSYFDEGGGSVHDFPRDPGGNIPQGVLAAGDHVEFPVGTLLALPGNPDGTLALATTQRVRFSNGAATTYHWPVSITNLAAATADLVVEATADLGVELRLPGVATVAPQASKVVDVFATVPFMHEHGGQRVIRLRVSDGAQSATMDLEIRYLAIPQPAGHHATVFGHYTRNEINGQWLDTVEQTEAPHEDRIALGPTACSNSTDLTELADRFSLGAFFPLRPSLVIGIDGRLGELAHLSGILDVPVVLPAGSFRARLEVYDPREFSLHDLPDDAFTARQDIPLTQGPAQVPLALEIPLPPEFDRIPPGSPMNVALNVAYCPDDATSVASFALLHPQTEPRLLDALRVDLPLDEYHDIIPLSVQNGPTLGVDEAQRRVRPGGSVLWEVTVAGNASGYVAELFGVSAPSATLHGTKAEPGGVFQVSLQAPAEARPGDLFEVVLSAHAEKDITAASAIRLTAVVDPVQGTDDTQAVKDLGSPAKKSPLPATAALVAVAFALLVRRR